MSETSTTVSKFVIHENGHLKRIDASANGNYGFNVADGVITMKAIETDINTSSFKDANGTTLMPTSPFIPIAQNRNGFVKLPMPTTQDTVCGIVNKGASGYVCQDLTGENVITQQYKLTAQTDGSAFYYYNSTQKKWKVMPMAAGCWFLMRDSNDINPVKFTPLNVYKHAYGFTDTENSIIQWNKGTINKIDVPTVSGNYNIGIDSDGKLSFTKGEVTKKLAVTYKLSAKEGKRPTMSDSFTISSGDENIAFDSTYKLKTNAKFFVDAKFTFVVNDCSVFDNMTQPAKFSLKLGSDNSNIIDSCYVYHPENGILELKFSGISKKLINESPAIGVICDEAFTSLNVNLSFADSTNLGIITFIEV